MIINSPQDIGAKIECSRKQKDHNHFEDRIPNEWAVRIDNVIRSNHHHTNHETKSRAHPYHFVVGCNWRRK